ncbi:MAG: hypothetical protein KY428_02750 [Bacteroidetes bacterium]|nr:hypothetical protein [Bacteroidota bacterium]
MGSISLYAQQGTTPPSRVSVKFKAKYPQQADRVEWKQAGKEYTATFTESGNRVTSRFGEDGQWLGSETQLKDTGWPAPMRKYMEENHAGYRFLQGTRFEEAKNSRHQIDVVSKSGERYRLEFDGKGNFVNERPLVQ